jgi:hypothetical protein
VSKTDGGFKTMRKTITTTCLLLLMLLSTAAVYAEVTRKAISNPDGTTKQT